MGTVVTETTPALIACLKWSPCGKYIVLGDLTSSNIRIYTWNGTSVVAGPSVLGNAAAISLEWSPDGNYIITGDLSDRISLYQFTGIAVTPIIYYQANDAFSGLSWSADGKYIVASSISGVIIVVRAMYGPANCLIDNCRVSDTAASNLNMGRGFVAGGTNLFVTNASSNNTVSYSYGIPNVYDGRFEISRNAVQPFDNISVPTLL
jgi:WD40 repeat protein